MNLHQDFPAPGAGLGQIGESELVDPERLNLPDFHNSSASVSGSETVHKNKGFRQRFCPIYYG